MSERAYLECQRVILHEPLRSGRMDYWLWRIGKELVPYSYCSRFKADRDGFADVAAIEPYKITDQSLL